MNSDTRVPRSATGWNGTECGRRLAVHRRLGVDDLARAAGRVEHRLGLAVPRPSAPRPRAAPPIFASVERLGRALLAVDDDHRDQLGSVAGHRQRAACRCRPVLHSTAPAKSPFAAADALIDAHRAPSGSSVWPAAAVDQHVERAGRHVLLALEVRVALRSSLGSGAPCCGFARPIDDACVSRDRTEPDLRRRSAPPSSVDADLARGRRAVLLLEAASRSSIAGSVEVRFSLDRISRMPARASSMAGIDSSRSIARCRAAAAPSRSTRSRRCDRAS